MTKNHLETLWYTRCPVPTGLGIAIQQGWLVEAFAAQDTKVESLLESNDFAVRESHFSHTLPNSVRHGGNIPAISARSRGRDTRLIGLSWADEAQLILAAPESGITRVNDLKGRRFGLPNWKNVEIDFSRAQAIRGLENALRLEGLEVADVELVNSDIESHYSDGQAVNVAGTVNWNGRSTSRARANNLEVIALLRGEVDAIFLKGAHGAQVAPRARWRSMAICSTTTLTLPSPLLNRYCAPSNGRISTRPRSAAIWAAKPMPASSGCRRPMVWMPI
jgi:ABC-type nitrate/sulfonate/bicarbonate transport system substrate-binding protein